MNISSRHSNPHFAPSFDFYIALPILRNKQTNKQTTTTTTTKHKKRKKMYINLSRVHSLLCELFCKLSKKSLKSGQWIRIW